MNCKTITVKNLDKVVSSNIDSIAHDGEKLYVLFKNGGLYSYEGADINVYNDLRKAESVGRHFRSNIQQGEYKHERLEGGIALQLEKKDDKE